MRKLLLALILAGILITAMIVPALAINDVFVPANECSGHVVGAPAASTGLAQADKVGPPVSANNPGVSTGAQGQANANMGQCQSNP